MIVTWTVADPGARAARLAERLRLPRPDLDAAIVMFELIGGALRLVRGGADVSSDAERLEVSRSPGQPSTGTARIRLLGIGWATVELERSEASVGTSLRMPIGPFSPAPDDAWLGARARRADRPDGVAIVLLEPTTEGRLAAALARSGEGPIAIYLGLPGPAAGSTRSGPLGSAAIVHAERPWGPYVLAVAAAATIAR
jgi:hypothetical protein